MQYLRLKELDYGIEISHQPLLVETDLGNQDEAWLISSNELSERLNTKPIER